MAQGDILSYILLGRPLNSKANDSSTSQLLLGAASAFTDEDSTLSSELKQTFGLSEAELDTSDGAKNASFVLGKYLNPKLYVSYGIGIFDAVNVFKMRYLLTKYISIESQTGKDMGIDVNYNIEW
jgi:translocation and assembly module TamB